MTKPAQEFIEAVNNAECELTMKWNEDYNMVIALTNDKKVFATYSKPKFTLHRISRN